jgi:uncharacterized protein YdhG (YjbR/CyaY superfamily)
VVRAAKIVDSYIARSPMEVRPMLKQVRAAIWDVAPNAVEGFSYRLPFYDYKGPLAWFGYMNGYIGLYLRPPIIAKYKEELAGYVTTKSAIHIPTDRKMPIQLIRKLVKARMKVNEAER